MNIQEAEEEGRNSDHIWPSDINFLLFLVTEFISEYICQPCFYLDVFI